MKYRVQVKEINYGSVIVDADSPEEALEIAKYPYNMGDIIWSSGEHELSNPEKHPNSKMNCFLKKVRCKMRLGE